MLSFVPPFISVLLAIALAATACAQNAPAAAAVAPDELAAAFTHPAPSTRPFVRWWWNGGRVDAAELTRELDVLQAAGIGGVEINTIGLPDGASPASLAAHPPVTWLSPEWIELVRHAAAAAQQRGLTADLIVGSGWPFGGRFLQPEEQAQRILLVKRPVTGPSRLTLSRAELLALRPPARPYTDDHSPTPTASALEFLRLVPRTPDPAVFAPGRELLPEFDAGGGVGVEIPAGEHVLYVGIHQTGFSEVKLGAPGADGPVVDHFNDAAVRKYLEHLSSRLAPALGGSLGPTLRAMFIDSLELDHANWTGDFAAEFHRRRGYELAPYLPFLLDAENPGHGNAATDTVGRARQDFCRTLLELFAERFLATYRTWAGENRVRGRIQAYGRETHPLHGSMEADLPEGETWLWVDKTDPRRLRVDSTVVNKYVSSAANLTGQRLRSFEAMTNAVPVFRETLQDFKRGLDATFVAGLNHPIFHGFNYSPPDAGFPGWVRFGSYLDERNPSWRYFGQLTDYAARIGTVLRHSASRARVGVLAPRADEWARHGLLYQPFPEVADPWFQFKLIDALQQAGYNADYISDRILATGQVANGSLTYGPCAYALLLVPEVESLEPAAAAALARFVATGGRVIFIGATPHRAPGLFEAAANDAAVQAAFASLQAAPGARVWQLPSPVKPAEPSVGGEETLLLNFVRAALTPTGLVPDVEFAEPRWTVSQLRQEADGRAIYFLANTDPHAVAEVNARFPGAQGRPELWDPLTGARSSLPVAPDGRVALTLEPVGSALIVFNPAPAVVAPAPAPLPPPAEPAVEVAVVAGPWQLRLEPAGGAPAFERVLPALADLSGVASDPALFAFGGTVTYTIEFEADAARATVLDLGEVNDISEVVLNGVALGSRWWGRHRYPVEGRLHAGQNRLEIRVSTCLVNLMRHKLDDPAAQRWAGWAPPIAAGLVGPVRLLGRP